MFEAVVHGIFLLLGLITVGCVLLITVYLIISGIPAIQKIGLVPFLTGEVWSSTSAEPKYGILPFILTSVYGTAGAIVLGVPIGFLTAVYLSKVAPKKVRTVLEAAASLLAGIPSVVYGLVSMLVLVPAIRKTFHLPDGASLFAAIFSGEYQDGPVQNGQRAVYLCQEIHVAGSIHNIDFTTVPLERSDCRLNGNSTLPLQKHSVRSRCPFFDAPRL